jgi:hypothetical protein
MGYFGSAYGSNWSANAPSSNSMMFTPNQYGGYSTSAAGTGAGREAASQLQQMRGMLGGTNSGQSALRALAPYMSMTVAPPDMMQRMQQTLGGFGMGNVLGQATQYAQKLGAQSGTTDMGGGSMASGGFGGQGQQANPNNPLGYLSGVFGQYGGGSAAAAPTQTQSSTSSNTSTQGGTPTWAGNGYVNWGGKTWDTANQADMFHLTRKRPVSTRSKGPQGWGTSTQYKSILDMLGPEPEPTTP